MGDDTETCLLILMALSEAYALVHFPKLIIHTMIHFLGCDRKEFTITLYGVSVILFYDVPEIKFWKVRAHAGPR